MRAIFELMKEHINSRSIVLRSGLAKKFGDNMDIVDTYRKMLTETGYLEHTGIGHYTPLKKIPDSLRISHLKEEWKQKTKRTA